ncbi:hypothetical protein [Streptomyces sp. NPDC017448]|uniref:hypothetical protein n=1 Tax=Streptomyces sp. NPDC017448 TaxID=3364996 RepID=UPI00378E4A2B
MIPYEKIYQDLCDRYSADDVHAFFNVHEQRVRERVQDEGLVQQVRLKFSSHENKHDTLTFRLKLGRSWAPQAGAEFVFESCTLRVYGVQRFYFEGVSEPTVELVCVASARPEELSATASFAEWQEVLSEIEHISDIQHQ